MNKLQRQIRSLHTSCVQYSHIGSTAIVIPSPVNLNFPFSLPASSTSTGTSRTLSVSGPRGQHTLPIPHPIILEQQQNQLNVRVLDEEDRKQRSLWGLTRTLINNAVVGVSTGYTLDLRLVGVGYRATVEQIPEALVELQKQIPRNVRPPKPGQQPIEPPPTPLRRLNLKLGYAHPVFIDIPEDIQVTTPAPTSIVLAGNDKQKLGLFAANIRRWRKPEPYRGKVSQGFALCSLADIVGYFCRRRDDQAQGDKEKVAADADQYQGAFYNASVALCQRSSLIYSSKPAQRLSQSCQNAGSG